MKHCGEVQFDLYMVSFSVLEACRYVSNGIMMISTASLRMLFRRLKFQYRSSFFNNQGLAVPIFPYLKLYLNREQVMDVVGVGSVKLF